MNTLDFAQSRSHGSTSSSLIARIRRRETDAWSRLSTLYGPLVYYWLRRGGVGPTDCVDVCQEVFLSVLRGIDDFRGGASGSFRGWLWTITRNKIHDFHRGQAQRDDAAGGTNALMRMRELPGDMEESDDDLAQIAALCQRAVELMREDFEPDTWKAFWRVVVEGRSTADVAAELNLSANAVRQHKCRVLRRLREELGEPL